MKKKMQQQEKNSNKSWTVKKNQKDGKSENEAMETKWEKRIKQLTTGNYKKAGFEVCLGGLAQLSSSVISFRALWTHFKVW